ncbi:MAG: hypothetical protein HQL60_08860 [Magnetococcales bacterium]|nr:hypothetical protein [Magnetococcales bacterium]
MDQTSAKNITINELASYAEHTLATYSTQRRPFSIYQLSGQPLEDYAERGGDRDQEVERLLSQLLEDSQRLVSL